MTDRYSRFATTGPGRVLVRRLGLPDPPRLRRHHEGARLLAGPVLLGGGGRLTGPVTQVLAALGADIRRPDQDQETAAVPERGAVATGEPAGDAAGTSGVVTAAKRAGGTAGAFGSLVFDATGITAPEALDALYEFFHPNARSLVPSGRVIVLGTPPEECASPGEQIAQRALEGFTRSVGKEFGRGTTAQLVYVRAGAEDRIASTLRFLLSGRSAYVSGQVIRIGTAVAANPEPDDWDAPLAGRVALVTGSARGIGASVADVLAALGATVICLDVPAAGDALATVANRVGGVAYQLDLTLSDGPDRLAEFIAARFGRVDIVVHNAGITRDKTIARMAGPVWSSVIAVNLLAPDRVNDALLARDLIPPGGRIIGVSSIAGIAGNRGQTNYATSKAGVIGLVDARSVALAGRGITVNAVAPGFIETAMTARMPVVLREAGRRMNSMAQGGLPVDVAEAIAWFASPGSSGLTGNVVRVCGQSLLGA